MTSWIWSFNKIPIPHDLYNLIINSADDVSLSVN